LVTNSTSPLGPWAVDNYLLIWPFFAGAVYLLFFSIIVAFRPTLHRLWAFGIIMFHVGNYLVINIGFNAHDFLISLLLILSPFAPAKVGFWEIVRDLPIIDFFIRNKGKPGFLKNGGIKIAAIIIAAFIFGIIMASFFKSSSQVKPGTNLSSIPTYPSSKIPVGEVEREYMVHVPKNPESENPPAVIILHGGGGPIGTAELLMDRSGWREKAEKEGFIAVFPQGLLEDDAKPVNLIDDSSDGTRNIRSWNSGDDTTPSSKKGVDDVGFIKELIKELKKEYNIDSKRVYITGFSNGATMSFLLGVRLSEEIAAIAPVAGLLYAQDKSLNSPVSLLTIVGSEDRPPENRSLMLIKKAFAASFVNNPVSVWANFLDCPNEQKTEQEDGAAVSKYGPCANGTEVITYRIEGMGHVYPGIAEYFQGNIEAGNKINAVEVTWAFFEKHSK
jgi:polyhydroxybutyrate depolymerase